MSRVPGRSLVAGLLVLAGCLGSAAPAWAQDPESAGDLEERLTARIDSLLPILETARHRAERADSLVRARELERTARQTTEIRVGPLRVVAREDQAELARGVMGEVWDEFDAFVEDGEPIFDQEVYTFQVYGGRPSLEFDDRAYSLRVHGGRKVEIEVDAPADRVHRVEINALFGRDALREKAASLVAEVLNRGLDQELRRWGRIEPSSAIRGDAWLYRELVVSASRPGQRCFLGEASWCWEAVGVATDSHDLWTRWYSETWWRERARRELLHPGHELHPLQERCAREGDHEACKAFLQRYLGDPDPPLSHAARSSLLMFTLQKGGQGAYARLLQSDGNVRERLTVAAGMTPDALMGAWLDRIRRARPDPRDGGGRSGAATLAWLAIFGFLATRSTRWRSG